MKLGIIVVLSVALLSLVVVAGFAVYNGTTAMSQNQAGMDMNGNAQSANQNGMMNNGMMNMDQMHQSMGQMMNGTYVQQSQSGHGCH